MLAVRSYDDFPLGSKVVTRCRTVDQSDINAFAGLSWDFYPLHTDEIYAGRSRFGRRIAHGPLVYAMAVGLMPLDWFGDAIVAFLGVHDLQHLAPVYPGDTIHVDAAVLERVDGRNGGGVVVIEYTVMNQDTKAVMRAQLRFLMRAGDDLSSTDPEER